MAHPKRRPRAFRSAAFHPGLNQRPQSLSREGGQETLRCLAEEVTSSIQGSMLRRASSNTLGVAQGWLGTARRAYQM
jgi:hypothetical protein